MCNLYLLQGGVTITPRRGKQINLKKFCWLHGGLVGLTYWILTLVSRVMKHESLNSSTFFLEIFSLRSSNNNKKFRNRLLTKNNLQQIYQFQKFPEIKKANCHLIQPDNMSVGRFQSCDSFHLLTKGGRVRSHTRPSALSLASIMSRIQGR